MSRRQTKAIEDKSESATVAEIAALEFAAVKEFRGLTKMERLKRVHNDVRMLAIVAAEIVAMDKPELVAAAKEKHEQLGPLRPGMKVLDMGAGGGYSTELLARAVAPGGVVYGQNPAELPERPKTAFEARLKSPGNERRCRRHPAVRRPSAAGRRPLRTGGLIATFAH
jgi:hypothetical protein